MTNYEHAVWCYARVSSKDQNPERQTVELEKYATTPSHLIVEKASGKDFDRPMYQSMKNLMRAGDILVIKSLDRLGRNYEMIKDEWKEFRDRGIKIKVLDMPLISTDGKEENDLTQNLISDIVLGLLSYVAESERCNIKARQKEGIKVAKKNGKHFGRPKTELPDNWKETVYLWKNGEITAAEAMRRTGVKRTTFYRLVN